MAITALDLTKQKEVTFPKDKVDPTVWVIGTLDGRVDGMISDRHLKVAVNKADPDGDADVKLASNALAFERVQFGLKGWRNYKDGEGNDISRETVKTVLGSTSYDVVSPEQVAAIPADVRQWLSEQIAAMNALTAEEGKA